MRSPRLVSELLSDVKLLLGWPSSGGPVTDAEILALAQRVIEGDIYAYLGRGHLLTSVVDVPLRDPAAQAYITYPLPADAMVRIEAVTLVDPNGLEGQPIPYFAEAEYLSNNRNSSDPRMVGYAVRGTELVLLPHPTTFSGYKLRVRYHARPLAMIDETPRRVTSLLAESLQLELTMDSATAPTNPIGAGTDAVVLSAASPHVLVDVGGEAYVGESSPGYVTILWGNWPATITTDASRIQVGDIVCGGYNTPVIQAPHEAYDALVQGTCAACARVAGDGETYALARGERDRLYAALESRVTPRAEGQKVIVAGNSAHNTLGTRR